MAKDKKDLIEDELVDEIAGEEEKTGVTADEKNAAPEDGKKKLKKPSRLKRFLSTKKGKAAAVLFLLVITIGILFAVPTTRYGIIGAFMKKNVKIVVTDSVTKKPVSKATVTLGNKSVKTSAAGEAAINDVPVGEYDVTVSKKYYKKSTQPYTVPILSKPRDVKQDMVATGRQVEIHVANTVTKAALAKATITVGGTSAVTDSKGIAVVVLPADKKSLKGTITLDGYNESKVAIKPTEQPGKNNFTLTPIGKLYYLSNQTGTINVMKANLDGSAPTVAIRGTGNEDRNSTVLLAARDWKYLTLSAHRTNDQKNQLYLVDTKTDTLKTIDEGNVEFNLVGWSDHRFIYTVYRHSKQNWESGRQALKSYDAQTGKLVTLDETVAKGAENDYGYKQESINQPYILDNKIVYGKTWNTGSYYDSLSPSGEKAAIMSVDPNGANKKRLKEFPVESSTNIDLRLYEPQEIYIRVNVGSGAPSFYIYENGEVKGVSNTDTKFYSYYPTYLLSPSGNKTFWHENRDGKNTLFIGDRNGKDGTVIASLSDFSTYGWYGDDYILLSKGGSELYIASSEKPLSDTNKPLKVTDYHKSGIQYPGYGYGYGGL